MPKQILCTLTIVFMVIILLPFLVIVMLQEKTDLKKAFKIAKDMYLEKK